MLFLTPSGDTLFSDIAVPVQLVMLLLVMLGVPALASIPFPWTSCTLQPVMVGVPPYTDKVPTLMLQLATVGLPPLIATEPATPVSSLICGLPPLITRVPPGDPQLLSWQ